MNNYFYSEKIIAAKAKRLAGKLGIKITVNRAGYWIDPENCVRENVGGHFGEAFEARYENWFEVFEKLNWFEGEIKTKYGKTLASRAFIYHLKEG